MAADLGALGLRKLRFDGEITPEGRHGYRLAGNLGATVIQACVVTLDPVTTRIDTKVSRSFAPDTQAYAAGSETEMAEEDADAPDPLGSVIDLSQILTEALAIALPDYPRKDDAALEGAQFTAPGIAPMTDADARPFAGLAALRGKLGSDPKDGE
jgi:uncharacterized metal-binding protein YceD (DUF177 family)